VSVLQPVIRSAFFKCVFAQLHAIFMDVQQIADLRHAISAFAVGLAPSASGRAPRSSGPPDFRVRAGFDSGCEAVVETQRLGGACSEERAALFFATNTARGLLVFLLVSAAIGDKNWQKFRRLLHYAVAGQGTRLKTLIITMT
jgi:hypothetical protein